MANQLTLYVGNTKPFDISIGESLSGADHASFTMMNEIGGTVQLQRDVQGGNLSIDIIHSKLTGTISGAEADALAAGTYVAQAAVRFGDADSWRFTEYFYVEVKAAVVAKVP